MTIKIRIETDNAAFDGESIGPEVARILRNLADRIADQDRSYLAQDGQNFNLRDENGNTVGRADMSDVDPGDEDGDQDEDEDEDEDETLQTCPACGGDAGTLGTLGNLEHMSCRDCGAEFSHEV